MAKVSELQDGRSKKRPGAEQQKLTIVDAAVDLFSIKGSGQVSIAEICSRADVGRQTFYRCFSSKDDLIRFLFQYSMNEHIEAALSELLTEKTDQAFLPSVVDKVIDAILERHKLARFLYLDSLDKDSVACKVYDDAVNTAAVAIQAWYEKNRSHKPSIVFLKSIMAGTTWLVQNAIESGLTDEAVQEAKQCSQQLFYGAYLAIEKS